VPALDPAVPRIVLPEGEAHHLTRVLRLETGAAVRVFDGRGKEWSARLVPSERRGQATVELLEQIQAVPEPVIQVTLAAGILKGDHMDAIVRDATMMGVARIVPLVTAHVTVPHRAWKGHAALDRWRRVAVASAKQCGRAVVPEISPPTEFAEVVTSADGGRAVMFVEPARGAGAVAAGAPGPPNSGRVLVLLGPEGGWSVEEVDRARRADMTFVHLGARTIRADAMAVAALSALWTAWGW
jgi:16S rRNA (uracil1498-N3)-methyltransferase